MGKARQRDTIHGDKRPNRLRVIRSERTVEDLLTQYMKDGHPPDDLPSPQTIAKYETMRVSIPSERLPALAILYGVDERQIFFEPDYVDRLPSAAALAAAWASGLNDDLLTDDIPALSQTLALMLPTVLQRAAAFEKPPNSTPQQRHGAKPTRPGKS